MSDDKKRKKEERGKKSGDPMFSDELCPLHGTLRITVRDAKTNKIEKEYVFDNLVMTFLRLRISHLFAGNFQPDAAANESYITQLQVGTSGVAEDASDAAITNPVTITPLAVTYPSSNSVQFEGILASGSGNGITFREAGLVFGNPASLATRRVFPPMEKSSLWIWEINWLLYF